MSDGKRLFDYDPDTKTTTWFIPTDDGFQLYTEQDVSDIIEANKAKQSAGADYYKRKSSEGEYWRVASIPNIFVLKFLDDHGVNVYGDQDHVKATMRLLDSSDYRFLKTTDRTIV